MLFASVMRELESPNSDVNLWLWKLSEPVEFIEWAEGVEYQTEYTEYLISAANAGSLRHGGETETLVFPASPEGEILSYRGLEGSLNGRMSHREAIERFLQERNAEERD